jgi:hypothetical protein
MLVGVGRSNKPTAKKNANEEKIFKKTMSGRSRRSGGRSGSSSGDGGGGGSSNRNNSRSGSGAGRDDDDNDDDDDHLVAAGMFTTNLMHLMMSGAAAGVHSRGNRPEDLTKPSSVKCPQCQEEEEYAPALGMFFFHCVYSFFLLAFFLPCHFL